MPTRSELRRFQAQPRWWRTRCLRLFSPIMTPSGGHNRTSGQGTRRSVRRYRGSGRVR